MSSRANHFSEENSDKYATEKYYNINDDEVKEQKRG